MARNTESLREDFAPDDDDRDDLDDDLDDDEDLDEDADFADDSDVDYDDESDVDDENEDADEDDDESDEEESLDAILTKETPRRTRLEDSDEIDFAGQPDPISAELMTRADPLRDNQEFVCSRCHLVKARSQLADRERQLCRDCV